MYEQEECISSDEIQERVDDLTDKIAYLDNNFNHKNFKLVQDTSEIELNNFLAKNLLSIIRGAFIHEINTLNKKRNPIPINKK